MASAARSRVAGFALVFGLALGQGVGQWPAAPFPVFAAEPPSSSSSSVVAEPPRGLSLPTIMPPSLGKEFTGDPYPCKRDFQYRGKTYPCDSFVKMDGEGMRSVIREVPTAVSELNVYQANVRRLEMTAYTGSIGLAIFFLSGLVFQTTTDMTKGIEGDSTRRVLANVGTYGGLAIFGFSALYGISIVQNNEDHLMRAVSAYNQARPEDTIEIQVRANVLKF